MIGHIDSVYRHECAPDWAAMERARVDQVATTIGAVWECDVCAKTWVAIKAPPVRAGQQRMIAWRPEKRRERRRRERAS